MRKLLLLGLLLLVLYTVTATVSTVFNAPNNYYESTSRNVLFNWTPTSDVNTTMTNYIQIYNGSTWLVNTTVTPCTNATHCNRTISGFPVGFHQWRITAEDNDGNVSTSYRWLEIRPVHYNTTAIILYNDTRIEGTLNVTDDTYFHNNVTVDDDLIVGNDVYVGRDLNVTRNTTTQELTVAKNTVIGNVLRVLGNFYANVNSYFGGGYGSTGLTIFDNGNLSTDGDIIIGDDLFVGDDATITGDLYVTTHSYFGGGYGDTGTTIYDNGNISTDGNVTIGGTTDLQDTLTLSKGGQDYLFTDEGNNLALQGQSSATPSYYKFFTKDGDATDSAGIIIFGKGTPTAQTNIEALFSRWSSATSQYEIFTEADGTGTLRPLAIYTEGSSGILLEADGDISLNNTNLFVDVSEDKVGIGTITPTHELHVVGDANITGDIYSAGNLTISGDIVPASNNTGYIGYGNNIWNMANVNEIFINEPPAACSAGNYMTQFKGNTSICVAAVKTTGDNRLVGNYSIGGTLNITPLSAHTGIFIDQDYNARGITVDSQATGNAAIYLTGRYGLTVSQDISDGIALDIFRDNDDAETSPLVTFKNDHATDTKPTLSLQNDGSGAHITTGATNENLEIDPSGTGDTRIIRTADGSVSAPLWLQNAGGKVGTAVRLVFSMLDSASALQEYGQFDVEIDVNTSGSEDSTMRFKPFENGAATDYLVLNGNTAQAEVTKNLLLSEGAQDYLIRDRSNNLEFAGRSSGTAAYVGFSTADADATDSSGLIIYGTSTPVAAANPEYMYLRWNTATSKYELSTEADGTGTLRPLKIYIEGYNGILLEADGDIAFNNTNLFVDVSTNNIGIGTISPDYTLDVVGDIGIDVMLHHNNDADTFLAFYADEFQAVVGNQMLMVLDEDEGYAKLGDGAVDVNLNAGSLFVGGSDGSYNGNVGINTTTPAYKLDVDGDIALNLTSTNRLILPLSNDAVTPTISFGDGDSGIYEISDDRFRFSFNGVASWLIDATTIETNFGGGAILQASGASATVPVFTFGGDADTGLGSAGANALSLIAGAVEIMRLENTTTGITINRNVTITGATHGITLYNASNDAFCIQMVVSTLTSTVGACS